MPIAIDASSPAAASGGGSIVSAAFSPPAGSLLVAVVGGSASSPTISNSGTARTWTLRKVHTNASYKGIAIYTADNPTALSNITVTMGSITGGFKLYVVTGAHPSSPVGATNAGTTATNNATVNAYTSTAAGSRAFLAAVNWNGAAAPSSTDDESAWFASGFLSGMAVTKAANTATAGENVTFNLDADGTGTADWNWVAVEILGAALDASADLTIVEVPTTVHTPSVGAGASASPGTVNVPATTFPPSVSAGAGATAGPVLVPVTIPAPNVTLDETEIAQPATVDIATSVPAPDVSAGMSVQLGGAVAIPVAVFTPDVDAEFNASADMPLVAVSVAVPTPAVTVPVLPGDQLDGAGGQLEWNGFVLGRNSPYRWQSIKGWRGKEPPDSGNAPHANRHGSAPGRPLAREKTITWTGFIKATREEVEAAVLALENATPFLRDATQWPLVVNDLGTPYLQYGRIDRVDIPVEKYARLGHVPIVLQWIMADARRYNINATGVTCPKDVITTISNAGNTETNPLIVIPGPAVTPKMTNHTLNRVLEFGITLADGEELLIDTDLGRAKILVDDVETGDVMGDRSFSSVSVWDWVLDRGPQEVEFTTASGGTQAEVLYRDGWI